jgi:hypothetical protein
MTGSLLPWYDWADQKHAWALHSFNASELEGGPLDLTPEAVECWAADWRADSVVVPSQ